jgi:hypothetical protein
MLTAPALSVPHNSLPERSPLLPARPRLETKLQHLAALAGLAIPQFYKACRERATDAQLQPASAGQLLDTANLAQRLEASLPDHAGTALRTRAALCIVLLDPPGSDRLGHTLAYVRQVLGY